MAITVVRPVANTDYVLTAYNRLKFTFVRDAGEPYLQARLKNENGDVIATLKPVPFLASTDEAVVYVEPYLQSLETFPDNTNNKKDPNSISDVAEFEQFFTLEYRTDIAGSFVGGSTEYKYASAVRQLGNEPTLLNPFDLLQDQGGEVRRSGQYLTKFERKKLYWISEEANPVTPLDVNVFQNQNVYTFTFAPIETSMTFRARWYRAGVLLRTDSYNIATPFARGRHPVWRAELAYQYDEVIIDAITDGGDTMVSIPYDIVRLCKNPTIIKFVNNYGAWETWAFEGSTPRELRVSDLGEYSKYPDDLETTTDTGRYLKKRITPTIDVFSDNLRLDEAKALEDLIGNSNVLIYTGDFAQNIDADTDEWQRCKVRATDFQSYDTRNTRHSISLTLELNEVYTLSN